MKRPIYLDNHASTRLDPRVLEAMMPYFKEEHGNPASQSHSYGWKAQEAIEDARRHVAWLMGADPRNIVFTSGATEANNMVLQRTSVRKMVISDVEHKSVLVPAEASHCHICRIKVDAHGMIDSFPLLDNVLVSVMGANNEVGTIQPLYRFRDLKGGQSSFLFHADMAQMLGKERFDVKALGLDFASVSAHKMYGPKGVGALYVSDSAEPYLSKLIYGGQQEHGMRPGTVNVPGVVGFGKACELANCEMDEERKAVKSLRDYLEALLRDVIPGLEVYGHPKHRLTGNLCAHLPCSNMTNFMAFVESEVALSTGSACSGFSSTKSHVLTAMGVPKDKMRSVIRIGIGRFNTAEEMDKAAGAIIRSLDMANKGG